MVYTVVSLDLDMDIDGDVDFGDINPFVTLLSTRPLNEHGRRRADLRGAGRVVRPASATTTSGSADVFDEATEQD